MAQITLERRKGAVLGWLEAFEPFTITSVRPVSSKRPDLAIVTGDNARVMVLAGSLTEAYEKRFGKTLSWTSVSEDKERVTVDSALFKGKTISSSMIDERMVLVVGGETSPKQ